MAGTRQFPRVPCLVVWLQSEAVTTHVDACLSNRPRQHGLFRSPRLDLPTTTNPHRHAIPPARHHWLLSALERRQRQQGHAAWWALHCTFVKEAMYIRQLTAFTVLNILWCTSPNVRPPLGQRRRPYQKVGCECHSRDAFPTGWLQWAMGLSWRRGSTWVPNGPDLGFVSSVCQRGGVCGAVVSDMLQRRFDHDD